MSIETRKTRQGTSFTIRYRDSQGNQHRETLGLKEDGWDRRKARAEEHRRLAEKTLASPPLVDVAWEWFHSTAPQAAWKPRTLRAYKRSIARLEPLHDMRVRELRPKHVAEWISKHPYSAKTTNDDISVLHSIFDYAIRHELVEANPVTAAPRPKIGRRKWRILTPEEIQAVDREFTDEKARLMFRVLTRTGIRRGELRNLKVRDIDFDRCVIRITDAKTDEGIRSIAIPLTLAESLKTWCDGSGGYVFQSSRGNPVGAQWYTDQFNEALDRAGIDDYVRPFHDMRHTALTNEAATGKSNPIALMAKAGHRSMSTTRQYLQLAGVVFHDEAEALEERLNGK